MDFTHQAHVGARWAAQAHEPTYRPFKSRLLANGLQTSGPRGLEVGCPSPRAHLSPIQKPAVG